jgi:hypothetical protein
MSCRTLPDWRVSWIASGHLAAQPRPSIQKRQQQDPGVRGHLPSVKGCRDLLFADGKQHLLPGTLCHAGSSFSESLLSCFNTSQDAARKVVPQQFFLKSFVNNPS